MSGPQISREELENRLRLYFEEESKKGDVTPDQWQRVLSYADGREQRRWPGWLRAPIAFPLTRPIPAIVVTLVLAVIAGGVSLWIAAPWQGNPVGGPVPIPGPAGRPAPRYFDQTWKADKSLVSPGEPFTISVTLRNAWDTPIETGGFPRTAALDTIDHLVTPSEEAVAVLLASKGELPSSIQPGQEVTLVASVTPDVSARLQPGRYNVHIDLRFAHTPGKPEMGDVGLGLNSGTLFVVIPPEGALDKTVQVGETREVSGIRITLESIRFTPEQTTIVALAILPDSVSKPASAPATPAPPEPVMAPTPTTIPVPTPPAPTPPSLSAGATGTAVKATATPAGRTYTRATAPGVPPPTPTPTSTSRGGTMAPGSPTPTPTRVPLPPGVVDSFHGATAWYRVDGGPWRELRSLGYRATPEGVRLEWTLGPVSKDAQIFGFAVTRFLIDLSQRVDGLWEWSVPLQAGPSR